mmetsp:Transcript_4508/g.6882  ORF Transcript_4508/g.6882 Transcript_4508/m.6882 type:complete len:92 (+) Transcript_4508:69-344(+)
MEQFKLFTLERLGREIGQYKFSGTILQVDVAGFDTIFDEEISDANTNKGIFGHKIAFHFVPISWPIGCLDKNIPLEFESLYCHEVLHPNEV